MASTTLTGEEWRQLCLVNATQMHQFLTGIPGVNESGAPGLTADHLLSAFSHLERMQQFLTAWSKARAPQPEVNAPAQQESAPPNLETPPKRRGGWPAGKPRKPKVAEPEQAQ
ncbi:MAG: hypothetical protein KGL39_06500 [Patescibacteria group bacterium]|nr:hypothetical protein [Patescibacteria group bacterium]